MLKNIFSRFVLFFNKITFNTHTSFKHKTGWRLVVKPYSYKGSLPIIDSTHDFGPGTGDYQNSVVLSVYDPGGDEVESHRIEGDYTHYYLLTRRELAENLDAHKKTVLFSYGSIPLRSNKNLCFVYTYSPKNYGLNLLSE